VGSVGRVGVVFWWCKVLREGNCSKNKFMMSFTAASSSKRVEWVMFSLGDLGVSVRAVKVLLAMEELSDCELRIMYGMCGWGI